MHRPTPIRPAIPSTPAIPAARSRRPARVNGLLVALALLGVALPAAAQSKRCDLTGKDTTIAGASIKKCLDLDGLDGATITVPSNVTRIDNDGLSLCRSSSRIGGDADIAFVLDQSGSMAANYAWINPTTQDTIYYYALGGCSNTSTSGTINIPASSIAGKTAQRLVSNAGCRDGAGDPFTQRVISFEKTLDYMDSISDGSTAGYIGFAGGIEDQQSLLQLNSAANVARLKDEAVARHQNNTNYTISLSLAKSWLNNTSMRKTSKQAVIFISDGQPTSGPALAYLDTIKTNMPPVYTIYLGQGVDTAGYFRLRELAQLTGGTFNIIPPTKPDSLVTVVRGILNLILKDYAPETATVRNTSLSPVQDATAAMPGGFSTQAGGSWLIRLDNIVAIRPGSNSLSLSTDFKETTDGSIINRSINFTISATGAPATGSGIITSTQFSRACYDPSSLRILNGAGARPPALTELDSAYQLRLRTAPVSLAATDAASLTKSRGDDETPSLGLLATTADSSTFRVIPQFRVSTSGSDADGTLQSALFDSVIASWTHPRDPQDFARDTLLVRAANLAAQAWFSLTSGGAPTTAYTLDHKIVYIVIQDQQYDPRRTYTAMVTDDQGGTDSQTVILAPHPSTPGLLIGQLDVTSNPKVRNNGILEVSKLGDQLKVEYRDPTYGETAVGSAGYDQDVQENPRLEFTDESFVPLAPGTVWPPSKGKLYFEYSDDYAYGRIPGKAVSLILNSLRYGIPLGDDNEGFTLSLQPGSSGTRATWRGSLDLADAFPPVDSNGKAEARYRGEAVAAANGHDNVGGAQSITAMDSLLIAYPDSVAVLSWRLADTNSVPRGSEGLIIQVRDQNFSVATDDSAAVTLICARSGDSVSAVAAKEGPDGTYSTGTVVKDAGVPNVSDRILSCLSADQIRIRYVDPVFGTVSELVVDEVAMPVADPRGRTFLTDERVVLGTATPGATIHYTTDGSTPVPGSSPIYSGPIHLVGSAVIKAIATRPGWKDSKVMVETYAKTRTASKLEILDENGNEVVGGFLTGAADAVRVKVTTTQAGLGGVQTDLATKRAGDRENLLLANTTFLGTAFEFWDNIAFIHPKAGAAINDTVEATGTDTLIAVWTNPLDPTDTARDTLVIKPAFKAAEVYFTAVPNGPRITTYPDTTTMVYITVKTGPKDPSLVYEVTVSSRELGIDDEVVSLVEISSGVFLAQVPVSKGAKTPDVAGTLQVSAGGDQLVAVFIDPVFGDSYRGDAGFGQDVQESASLDFIHKDGRVVAPDEFWNPTEGKVYLRYSDDWLAGIDSLVRVRTGKVNLVNRKSGNVIGTDEETVTFTLVSQTATRGTWEGSVQLRDRAAATPANDTLETYYRGEAVATMTPHSNKGVVGGTAVTDQMVIAYPNQPAEIIIRDTSGGPVDRITPVIDIIVKDQIHTQTGDNSITVKIACEGSGDQLQSVRLVWNGTAYVADPPIRKGEGGAVQDSILQCRTTDRIVVTYLDPVYSDTKTGDVRWSDQKPAKLYFASARDSSVITSATDGVDNSFLVIVEGLSPTRDLADTIDVILTTNQSPKDSLKVRAVETGPLTGVFKVEVPYEFITRSPDPGNGRLEANINADARDNRVIVTAAAVVDGSVVKADLALFSAYNLVVKAWIKDEDGDGRADKAYFAFDKKLARLPASLEEVAWNRHDVDAHKQKASGSMLAFLTPDSNVVVADFSRSQFGANLTDIPSGAKPYGLFPSDNVFGGQRALLADSVGPVPVSGVKKPSNLASYSVSATEKRFYPDTLIITVSERLRTTTGWSDMIRFSKGCAPYSESVPLKLAKEAEPTPGNPLEWTLTVDNSPSAQIPLVGDCIFLETDGRYLDLPGNRPSPLGIPLTGENPNLVIRDFRGFPPVAGMDPGSSGFVLVTNDVKGPNSDGRWSTQTGNGSYQVIWIPPVGLEECNGEKDLLKCLEKKVPTGYDAKATPMRDIENQSFTPMPVQNLSAIQVIATGRYIARVNIYDNFGVHVRSFVQAFGFWGEEKNPWRATEKGLRSFIVWDLKDKNGQMAGQGVYVWKVNFSFSDRKSEVMYTRTGVMRN